MGMELLEILSLIGLGSLGYVIGFIGGMVGLVLGILRLPVIYFYGLSPAMAAGTNIGVSAMGAIAGSTRHIREGRVDLHVLAVMAASAAVGAFIGGYYSWVVAPSVLLIIIGGLVLYEGFGLARTRRPGGNPREFGLPAKFGTDLSLVAKEVLVGFSIGVLGGMVGLILGSLRLPAMLKVLKMDPRVAVGTNISIGAIMGTSGFLGHLLGGKIEWGILVSMGAAAIIGGYMGAKYTGRLEAYKLKRLIGYILLVVSLAFFWESYEAFRLS